VGGLQWLLTELTDTDIYAAEDEQNPRHRMQRRGSVKALAINQLLYA
jgi:hypothetical protein